MEQNNHYNYDSRITKHLANSEEKFLENRSGKIELSEEETIRIRKEKVIKFLKTKYNWIVYLILAFIVFLSVRIRTRNLDRLRDITTGTWTLGPDLDPFLFLRWAKYIVENGSLMAIDTMRYVPLGHNTKGELIFHPYMMAWFHKLASLFGSESVTHSAVLYPVFMFALTVIAFFFLTRKIFINSMGKKLSSIIALIASFLLSVIPVFLPRTIAGIPEKESAAFLFMFLALYLFLISWESKNLKSGILFAILAGGATAGMALIWGGYAFLFIIIAPAVFIAFILGSVDKKRLYSYIIWIATSFLLMYPFSTRYSIKVLFTSLFSGSSIIILFIILFHIHIYKPYIKKYFSHGKLSQVPSKIISTAISFIIILIMTIIFLGISHVTGIISTITFNLINPSSGRILQTVAENREPFFAEWSSSFGPIFRGIPVFFWMFFMGSIYLFIKLIKGFKLSEKIILTASYTLFLMSLVFSRYSASSTLNGTNTISTLFSIIGFITILSSTGYYYLLDHKQNKTERLKKLEFSLILLFLLFFISLIAARGTVRLILILVPSASIIASFFIVSSMKDALKLKDSTLKTLALIIVGILIILSIFAGWQFYKSINSQAEAYAPSSYTQQWQKAMAWVRNEVPQNAVFGHWWDYGYWVQSIGERATVLDGGNAIGYWNHMMGRYALTGPDQTEALEFLYAHDTTHFLIDSTDIGKYSAFSSIGSNKDYDRRSWISTFLKDNAQVSETKNGTLSVYSGGTALDGDIIYNDNGSNIFLPGGKAGIGAILVEKDSQGKVISNPLGIYVYQNKQYRLPLRYAYSNGKLTDFGSGVEAGIFIFPRVNQNNIEFDGASLYLSSRTVNSQLARLYLYNEENPNFKLIHSEDDFLVSQIKAQNPGISDIVFYNGVRGPIRIWEINYPSNIAVDEKYLLTSIPEEEGFEL